MKGYKSKMSSGRSLAKGGEPRKMNKERSVKGDELIDKQMEIRERR